MCIVIIPFRVKEQLKGYKVCMLSLLSLACEFCSLEYIKFQKFVECVFFLGCFFFMYSLVHRIHANEDEDKQCYANESMSCCECCQISRGTSLLLLLT